MTISLTDYANDRNYVVVMAVTLDNPMGICWPLGDPDFSLPEGFDPCGLIGDIDPVDKDWDWDGRGNPTDYRRNSITRVIAFPDKKRWKALASGR